MKNPIGRPKKGPSSREILTAIIPIKEMFSEQELVIYKSLTEFYLKDFDDDELTASDVDDIMVLAMNKIIEVRLLSGTKDKFQDHLDVSNSLEKLRKQNDKIKDNLSARRKDRVDLNDYKGFSIIDLAVGFDDAKKLKLELKSRKMREEQEALLETLENNTCKEDKD